ncbi:MAG: NUDIX domain-containing protein [Pirellulales bacterium]
MSLLGAFLSEFVAREDCIRRDNFVGHITVGSVVLHPDGDRFLTLDHLTLGRRLPPGGHIDAGDADTLAAIEREICEETGISRSDIVLINQDQDPLLPFDIDTHPIPASVKKNEPAHHHHDFRYAFRYIGVDRFPAESPEGRSRVDWTSIEATGDEPHGRFMLDKLRSLSM